MCRRCALKCFLDISQMKGPLAALRCQARTATSPVDGTELKALLERVGYTFSARF